MASTSMTATLTVNAAFLMEIKEVNLDLWRILAELRSLTWSASDCQSGRLLSLLEELRDQLALHFALEEAYGYFEDPAWVAPRLCERACALRAEHRQLYLQICDLVEEAQLSTKSWRRDRLIRAFRDFDAQLKRHESAENELILSEYDDDIGVGD